MVTSDDNKAHRVRLSMMGEKLACRVGDEVNEASGSCSRVEAAGRWRTKAIVRLSRFVS